MEIPNNVKPEYMMDFKKFAQSVKKLIYSEEKIWIEGKFKEEGNDKVFDKDCFWANKVHASGESISAEEIYRIYLEWFNRTLRKGERPRIFVSAEFTEFKEEDSEQ